MPLDLTGRYTDPKVSVVLKEHRSLVALNIRPAARDATSPLDAQIELVLSTSINTFLGVLITTEFSDGSCCGRKQWVYCIEQTSLAAAF